MKSLRDASNEFRCQYIATALRQTKGNQSAASIELKISYTYLRKLMHRFGLAMRTTQETQPVRTLNRCNGPGCCNKATPSGYCRPCARVRERLAASQHARHVAGAA